MELAYGMTLAREATPYHPTIDRLAFPGRLMVARGSETPGGLVLRTQRTQKDNMQLQTWRCTAAPSLHNT